MLELLDDALEANQFGELKARLTSGVFPWYYIRDTALDTNGQVENNFSFNNTVYDAIS